MVPARLASPPFHAVASPRHSAAPPCVVSGQGSAGHLVGAPLLARSRWPPSLSALHLARTHLPEREGAHTHKGQAARSQWRRRRHRRRRRQRRRPRASWARSPHPAAPAEMTSSQTLAPGLPRRWPPPARCSRSCESCSAPTFTPTPQKTVRRSPPAPATCAPFFTGLARPLERGGSPDGLQQPSGLLGERGGAWHAAHLHSRPAPPTHPPAPPTRAGRTWCPVAHCRWGASCSPWRH